MNEGLEVWDVTVCDEMASCLRQLAHREMELGSAGSEHTEDD